MRKDVVLMQRKVENVPEETAIFGVLCLCGGGIGRGSVNLSLPTEALQREVIRCGIVYNAVLYVAQFWSPRAQIKQCFNCNQWGHTQASCNKATRCGECAGTYQTRDCQKKSVSCCICGKAHRAWQKGACQTSRPTRLVFRGHDLNFWKGQRK